MFHFFFWLSEKLPAYSHFGGHVISSSNYNRVAFLRSSPIHLGLKQFRREGRDDGFFVNKAILCQCQVRRGGG
jgi:hypothetical protein